VADDLAVSDYRAQNHTERAVLGEIAGWGRRLFALSPVVVAAPGGQVVLGVGPFDASSQCFFVDLLACRFCRRGDREGPVGSPKFSMMNTAESIDR
jgi:hypothetical protein